jgi:hypothetical protein
MNHLTNVNSATALTLKETISEICPDLNLCGTTDKSPLDLSDELLAYICSVIRDESPTAPDATIEQWVELLEVLRANWLIPLFYRKIGSLPQECRPPEPIADEMRQAFLFSCVRSLHMEGQLREIIEGFQEQGVRVLVLRGPALAFSLYPDPAMRPSCDL